MIPYAPAARSFAAAADRVIIGSEADSLLTSLRAAGAAGVTDVIPGDPPIIADWSFVADDCDQPPAPLSRTPVVQVVTGRASITHHCLDGGPYPALPATDDGISDGLFAALETALMPAVVAAIIDDGVCPPPDDLCAAYPWLRWVRSACRDRIPPATAVTEVAPVGTVVGLAPILLAVSAPERTAALDHQRNIMVVTDSFRAAAAWHSGGTVEEA